MTEEGGFSVDELRKWHEENGFEERLACPICRFNIKPINDEEQLNFRGFSKNINPVCSRVKLTYFLFRAVSLLNIKIKSKAVKIKK